MLTTETFSNSITPLARRLQRREAVRIGWMTAGAGLGFTVLLLTAGRLFPLLPALSLLAIGLSLTAFVVVVGQLWVWLRPLSAGMVARVGDARLGLEERLTTALELLEGRLDTSAALRQAQMSDALAHLHGAPIAAAFPMLERRQSARVGGVFFALIVMLALLTWLPNPQTAVLQQRHQLDEILKTEITQLEQLQTDLLAQSDPVQAQKIEPLTDTLTELLDKLEKARADRSAGEALAALGDANRQVSQMDAEQRAQAQSLESMANALAQSDTATAQQMADALQNGDAQQAADTLSQAAENATPGSAEAQSLAQALNAAADAMAGDNPAVAQSLQAAADALAQADGSAQSAQAMQDALAQAAEQLAQTGDAAQSAAAAAQALQNIQQAQQALAQQGGSGTGPQRALGGQNGAGANGQGQGGGNGSGRGEPSGGNDGLFSVNSPNGIIPTDNGENQNRLEDYSSVFAPNHLGGSGGEFVQPDPQNPGGGVDVGEVPGDPNRDPGAATVPYSEVFREYSSQANSALSTDAIPLSMKDYVRQYFGALEP